MLHAIMLTKLQEINIRLSLQLVNVYLSKEIISQYKEISLTPNFFSL